MYEQMSMLDDIEGIRKLNNTEYTYKSPDLISTSYELSITQQRIISLACKKMQPIYIEERVSPDDLNKVLGAMKFRLINISVSEFRKEYNIKGKNIYQYLENEVADLYNQGFYYIGEDDKLKMRRWVSSCDFDRKNGNISLTFNIDILLDLLIFKGKYVALLFDMSQNIKSKYAFRIYEILKSKAYIKNYKISVDDLKFMLAIKGMYDDFANLNKKVIKPNIKVINDYSDINVEYDLIRSGRNVKWFEFHITKKTRTTNGLNNDNDFIKKIPTAYKEISNALNKYGVKLDSKDMETLCNLAMQITNDKYTNMSVVDYILSKIEILDNYIINNNIKNVTGLLISSMQNEYKESPTQKQNTNKFINFEPREYDYNDLEWKLLGWDKNIK